MCECQRKKCLVGISVEHTSNSSSHSCASLWPQVVSREELSCLLNQVYSISAGASQEILSDYCSRPQYRRGKGHLSWAAFHSLRQCTDWSRNTRTSLTVKSRILKNAVTQGKAFIMKVSPLPERNPLSCHTQRCALLCSVPLLQWSQAVPGIEK